jgi:hypothetical protein
MLFFAFSASTLYAQTMDPGNQQISQHIIDRGAGVLTKAPDMDGSYEGTPYLLEDFTRGNVRTRNGEQFDNLLINYNAFNDIAEIKFEADIEELNEMNIDASALQKYVLNELQINSFSLQMPNGTNRTFRNRVGVMDGEFDNLSYLEVLYEKETGLFRKVEKKFIEGGEPLGYGNTDRVPNRFEEESDLYFMDENGEFHEVGSRRRSVTRMFGDYRRDVRDFANSRNLDYDNPAHVAQMVMFYERQLEQ